MLFLLNNILLYNTRSISNIKSLLKNSNILILGDGDFSYSASLARSQICDQLVATTKDSEIILYNSFENAKSNVNDVLKYNGLVKYNIDATDINLTDQFHYIIFNFPHITGKQNIKYNRELIKEFLRSSSKNLMKSDINNSYYNYSGSIIITLCEGQSGYSSNSEDDWNFSWKLVEQAAEAGYLITYHSPFDINDFDGYKQLGHRGHGGSFLTGKPDLFLLQPLHYINNNNSINSNNELNGLQSPLYLHEIHMIADDIIQNLTEFELKGQQLVYQISNEYNFSDAVWSVHLVDIYQSPKSNTGVSHAFQITYCSLSKPISRNMANEYRIVLEKHLPDRLGLIPRKEKHKGQVSQCYPWYVAKGLKSKDMNKIELINDNNDNNIILPDNNNIINDITLSTDRNEYIRSVARSLWIRRAGVIRQKRFANLL